MRVVVGMRARRPAAFAQRPFQFGRSPHNLGGTSGRKSLIKEDDLVIGISGQVDDFVLNALARSTCRKSSPLDAKET